MELSCINVSRNSFSQLSSDNALLVVGGCTCKYLDDCVLARCSAKVDLPVATPARMKTTLLDCNKSSSFWMVLSSGIKTSVASIAVSPARGMLRFSPLAPAVSSVCCISRSISSAFLPDTFSPSLAIVPSVVAPSFFAILLCWVRPSPVLPVFDMPSDLSDAKHTTAQQAKPSWSQSEIDQFADPPWRGKYGLLLNVVSLKKTL